MYSYRFVILSLNLLLCYSFAQSNYYYSYDGAGNNLNQPNWGKQGNLVTREGPSLPFAYADGISAMRTDLPSSKVVSNDLFSIRPAQPMSGVKLSDLHTAWGFIMAHDISLSKSGGENSPIQVPQNDTKWNPSGIPIESYPAARMQVSFSRKAPTPNATAANPRSTYFTSTPFLDLQPFYGFTENTTRNFRDLNTKGRLKTSAGNNLPLDPIANGMSAGSVPGGQVSSETYFIGENQFLNFMPQVAPLATIFLREHNRKADELASSNPNWSGDKVFEEARRWVIALYQSITWNEYIPAMLDMTPTYTGYDSNMEPTIHALWLAAGCRYAHTELNSLIYPLDSDYNFHSGGPMLLRDNVQKTSPALKKYGADAILRGTLSHISMEFDSFYEDDMRVFGLGRFPGGGSFDIASMTIQRSRDLGIPGYNDVRVALGLSRKETFSEISTDPVVVSQLSRLYGSIDNIDFFVGALAESHVGKHFSESMAAAFENQVMRIINSDRLFYKSSSSGFSNTERSVIDGTSLADLILQHTEINKTQCKSFYWKGVRDCVRSTGNTGTTGTVGTTGTTTGNGPCTRVNSNTLPDSFPDTMSCCYGLNNPTITVPLSHNGDITLNFGNSIVMSDGTPISQGCNGGALFYKNGTMYTDIYKGNDGVTRNSIDVFYATGSTIKLRNIQSWQSNLPSLLNGKEATMFVTCNNGVSSCLKFNVVNP